MLCSDRNQHRRYLLPRNSSHFQAKIFKYIVFVRSQIRSTFCAMIFQARKLQYLFDFHPMFILDKSEYKFSITSNFVIIVFLSAKSLEVIIHRCSRTIKMVPNFTRYIFLEFEKSFRTSIFLSASKKCCFRIFQKQGNCFHDVLCFRFLSSLVQRQNVLLRVCLLTGFVFISSA